jgi:hypothetical protein
MYKYMYRPWVCFASIFYNGLGKSAWNTKSFQSALYYLSHGFTQKVVSHFYTSEVMEGSYGEAFEDKSTMHIFGFTLKVG